MKAQDWSRSAAKRVLERIGLEPPRRSARCFIPHHDVVDRYLRQIPAADQSCIDVGAADGISGSITYELFRRGWTGIAVEANGVQFRRLARNYTELPNVVLLRTFANPDNIVDLLDAASLPPKPGFLSLDIDGYDYFLLRELLSSRRPSLMCVEINEKIPPPIQFTVKYTERFQWRRNHCYGQSLSTLDGLAKAHGYKLLSLNYNNAFLAPDEVDLPAVNAEQAYNEGYRNRPDRLKWFPWNADMDALLTASPEEGVNFVREKFRDQRDEFECYLDGISE